MIQVGSRVRALHATWAGEVTALLPRRRLTVRTDDGHELTLSLDDVVGEAPELPERHLPRRSKESHAPTQRQPRGTAPTPPTAALDLHLAALPERYQALADREGALAAQLAYLEAQLMAALERRADRLVVLHGRGAGTLRAEIKRRLAGRPEIAALEPDVSGRYGLGAALVIRLR